MPRPIWKGDIAFGLVSIPVFAISVEESKTIKFHLLDERDKVPIHYKRVNENTGKEVPWEKIVKGYEYDKDHYVILDAKDFQRASPDSYKSINIEEFVDFSEIDPLYFDKPYYLLPDSKNKKAYVLLREALKKTQKAGVAKVIIRTKEYLSLIFAHEKAIILNLIHFEENLRTEEALNLPDASLKDYNISEREIHMATDLIKTMTAKWAPEKYHDEYSKALMAWIEKKTRKADKAEGKKAIAAKKPAEVVDFISLLQQSLSKKRG